MSRRIFRPTAKSPKANGSTELTDRLASQILGTLSCFDRVLVGGTLPDICHARALGGHLKQQGVRLFDFPKWAEPLRNAIREHAERVAADNDIEVEFVRRKEFRMADRARETAESRGFRPGLVHIFSAMEACVSFRPWYDASLAVSG